MNTSLGGHHGVQFVDDHVFDFTDDGLETRGRDGNGKAFRRGDENMGRVPEHFLTVGLRRVAGSKTHTDFLGSVGEVVLGDFVEWADEVALDVIGQCLDGRDVDGVNFLLQLAVQRQPYQLVDDGQERCKGLP